jgi:hypothetical protein
VEWSLRSVEKSGWIVLETVIKLGRVMEHRVGQLKDVPDGKT